jgi:hypothetical protein
MSNLKLAVAKLIQQIRGRPSSENPGSAVAFGHHGRPLTSRCTRNTRVCERSRYCLLIRADAG